MQRPWQEADSARFSTISQGSPEQVQIPGIATALGRQLPVNADHRLPPIATSFDAYGPRLQDGLTDSADLGSVRSSQPSSPLRSSSTRPGKRARWYLNQESITGFGTGADGHYRVSAHGHSLAGRISENSTNG
jgi:hypothetical protein